MKWLKNFSNELNYFKDLADIDWNNPILINEMNPDLISQTDKTTFNISSALEGLQNWRCKDLNLRNYNNPSQENDVKPKFIFYVIFRPNQTNYAHILNETLEGFLSSLLSRQHKSLDFYSIALHTTWNKIFNFS